MQIMFKSKYLATRKEKPTHKPKKKMYRKSCKNTHSDSKKWDIKLKNSSFPRGNSASEYIGPDRLTSYVGILAKGKISDSISRFEKVMPKDIRARAKQDLQRVLQCSRPDDNTTSFNEAYRNGHTDFNSASVNDVFSPEKENFESKRSYSVESNPIMLPHSNEKSPENDSKLLDDCFKTITKSLHPVIKAANAKIFPGISNRDKLIKQLNIIKNHYDSCDSDTIVLSSSNNESSQSNKCSTSFSSSVEENFKLNPILTEQNQFLNFTSLFPDRQEVRYNSSSSDDSSFHEFPLLSNKFLPRNMSSDNSPIFSTESDPFNLSLMPCSPYSNSASPVFRPKDSPPRFIHDTFPTPKLYYPQKMF